MDKTRLRLIQHASAWAALGLLYGCDAFTDEASTSASHTFSVAPAETNGVLQPVGGAGLPKAAALRMREENRYGLVLVVPNDLEQRNRLGTTLEQVMLATEGIFSIGREQNGMTIVSSKLWLATLSEFVVSCVPEWKTEGGSGARALIVNPNGQIMSATDLHGGGPLAFVHEIRALCAQEPGASERAAGVDPEALRRLEQYLETRDLALLEQDATESADAYDLLHSLVIECLPAMSQHLLSEASRRPETLDLAFWPHSFEGFIEHQESAPVIHGVKWNYEAYDACPWCGMGYIPAEKRVFDTFLDE